MAMAGSRQHGEEMELTRFKDLLLRSCGHVFENEREQDLRTKIRRRMAEQGLENFAGYFELLLRDNEELLRLTELLTVNETYFFREPGHLELMIDALLPDIMATQKRPPFRILSAGCSTGEEPYSIAILLRERFGAECERLFAITGVDIDSGALGAARRGIYGHSSFRGADQALVKRYFEPYGQGKFKIGSQIRQQVEFAMVNLLDPSYPSRLAIPDIILYRNVSIYFPQQIQRDIFANLGAFLAEGGCLLVGATETFHHDLGILSLEKKSSLFFYQKTPKLLIKDRRAASRNPWPSESAPGAVPKGASAPRLRSEGRRVQVAAAQVQERRTNRSPAAIKKEHAARFDEAVGLAQNLLHDQALIMLDAILAEDNSFTKAHCLKGGVLLALSRFEEARRVCEYLVNGDPLSLEAYLMLGMIERQDGNEDAALKRFREAIFLDSSCWLAHFFSGEILFSRRDFKRARSCFEATLKILGKGSLQEHGLTFFPLLFNAEQFMMISRHKLAQLAAPPRNAGSGP